MDENNCAGLVRAAFTPLSRFPVKRLNGCRLSSRQRERRSFSFEDRFTMRRRSVKDHREKEERERGEKGVKKGEEEEKKIGKEG